MHANLPKYVMNIIGQHKMSREHFRMFYMTCWRVYSHWKVFWKNIYRTCCTHNQLCGERATWQLAPHTAGTTHSWCQGCDLLSNSGISTIIISHMPHSVVICHRIHRVYVTKFDFCRVRIPLYLSFWFVVGTNCWRALECSLQNIVFWYLAAFVFVTRQNPTFVMFLLPTLFAIVICYIW